MEIEGILFKVLPIVKGTTARGEWSKQEVILELQSEFNRKVCISFWGDKTQDINTLKVGEKVNISVNVESREYNGRWFTEVRAWKVNRTTDAAAPSADMPPITMDSYEPSPSDASDDLPF